MPLPSLSNVQCLFSSNIKPERDTTNTKLLFPLSYFTFFSIQRGK